MGIPNSVLIKDVKIFTGTDIIDRGYVFVLDGTIAQVGKGNFNGDLTTGITVISRPGDTLIPGLIDAQFHALAGNVNSIEQCLRFGVTTVCDMHNEHKDTVELRKLASAPANKSKYADFKCAGLGAVVDDGWRYPPPVMSKVEDDSHIAVDNTVSPRPMPLLRTPEDAEPFVKQQIEDNGAAYISISHQLGIEEDLPRPPPIDVQQSVVAAAHKYGVITTGHPSIYAGAMRLLRAGVDGLSHMMFLDQPLSDDYVRLLRESNAHCSSTLGVRASQTDEGQRVQTSFLRDPYAQRMLIIQEGLPPPPPPATTTAAATTTRSLGLATEPKPTSSMENAYANTRLLYKAGVPLTVGTCAVATCKGTAQFVGLPYGLGMHMEMRALVKEVGMSPVDVLKSATSITADRFGFRDRGRIQSGRIADMVLIKGDVLEELANNDKDNEGRCLPIKATWREGLLASVPQSISSGH